MTRLLMSGPQSAVAHMVLAHGAGAPMDSPFLEAIASNLARHDIATIRFEFDYMAARRSDGVRRPPPKMDHLAGQFRDVVAAVTVGCGARLFIGGKSMGGRVASLVADALHEQGLIAGCVGLGYPFHPPKSAQTLRVAHLATLRCPTLIIQGTRDALGNRADVMGYDLSASIKLHWLDDGDHDFKPRKASGHTQDGHIKAAAAAMAAFAASTV